MEAVYGIPYLDFSDGSPIVMPARMTQADAYKGKIFNRNPLRPLKTDNRNPISDSLK